MVVWRNPCSRWLLLLGVILAVQGCNQKPPQVLLGSKATEMQTAGQACVEPTAVMRQSHMDFLLHQRDATVHEGVRTVKHSLKACIDCHVSHDPQGKPVPINAEGQFCQACHAYSAVKLDCFECHATKPAAVTSATTVAPPAAASAKQLPVEQVVPATTVPPGEQAPAVVTPPEQIPAAVTPTETPAVAPPLEHTSVVPPVSGSLVPSAFQSAVLAARS